MPSRVTYDLLYRIGAARRSRGWDKGTGQEVAELVGSGTLAPEALPRAVDLGCGTGANVLFLAERGFETVGVDFSTVAIDEARAAAEARGLSRRARFVVGDITAPEIPGVPGPFDLVVAYNTLQDLRGRARQAMAGTVRRLTLPGAKVVLWCYYARASDLPLLSFRGPSRLFPFVVTPGEERALFADAFDIERLPKPQEGSGFACFLLTRR